MKGLDPPLLFFDLFCLFLFLLSWWKTKYIHFILWNNKKGVFVHVYEHVYMTYTSLIY